MLYALQQYWRKCYSEVCYRSLEQRVEERRDNTEERWDAADENRVQWKRYLVHD